MAKRLSAFTDLTRYLISDEDTPKWRIHRFEFDKFLYANGYNAALNYGDRMGAGFEEVARTRVTPGPELAALFEAAPEAEAAIIAELATLDAADSSIIAGTDQTGLLKYNGRRELAAIEVLQQDALDPSLDQSATAVLDKISGPALIRSRQQQARTHSWPALSSSCWSTINEPAILLVPSLTSAIFSGGGGQTVLPERLRTHI